MKILLFSSTELEIRPLLQRLELLRKVDGTLSEFRNMYHRIDVLIPGIGMTHAAFHLGMQFAGEKYDLAVNAGIAGSYSVKTRTGEVFNVTSEVFGMFGAEDGEMFLSLQEMGFLDPDSFPYENGWLVSRTRVSSSSISKLPLAKGVTVNTISSSRKTVALLKKLYHGDIESMEGAAFFYACLICGIPCLQIRSVSNYVEIPDKSKWDIPLAVKTLNDFMDRFLNENFVIQS